MTRVVDLRSDTASAVVVNGQLADARVSGTPAQFTQRGGDPARPVRGWAGTIEYDLTKGVVTLSGEVWFSFGDNDFRGDKVVLDLKGGAPQVWLGELLMLDEEGRVVVRSQIAPADGSEPPPEYEVPVR